MLRIYRGFSYAIKYLQRNLKTMIYIHIYEYGKVKELYCIFTILFYSLVSLCLYLLKSNYNIKRQTTLVTKICSLKSWLSLTCKIDSARYVYVTVLLLFLQRKYYSRPYYVKLLLVSVR